tara:strand:+ start:187 stop:435 length:249 start_codon:yes stop_codon:yes gene_type:complete
MSMHKSIIEYELIQPEIIVETPLKSLRKSGQVKGYNSYGLVRLASSSGRLPTFAINPLRENKPDWRTLRARAKIASNAEVIA